jgi:site-specific recombinase
MAARAPRQRVPAAQRRRQNLTWLVGFIVVTFLLGLTRPLRPLLLVNLVADVALIAYVGAVIYFAARPVDVGAGAMRAENAQRPPEAAGGRF